MWIRRPTDAQISRYLGKTSGQPLSYPHVGATNGSDCPPHYAFDCTRTCLGHGIALFDLAKEALGNWRMFDMPWMLLGRPETGIEPDTLVAVVIRFAGVWWPNTCRIVYTVNEQSRRKRFGFAYGTLTDHHERGEERFLVELLPDESVWFEIRAFSQPAKRLSRLAYPLVRRAQKRFFAEAHAAMLRALHAKRD
jgi:uncharacterized protein (UPF0548 family)